jgi:hypothetical protein
MHMPSIRCSVCELVGETDSLPEAERWAVIHDQLRHRGHPTAAIVDRRRRLRPWRWVTGRRATSAA